MFFVETGTCVFYFSLNKENLCLLELFSTMSVQDISLSERDRLKLLNIKDNLERYRFVLQRLLLYEVLSIYENIQPNLPDIHIDQNGKPYLKSSSISFNISHSEEQYIIVVGSNKSQVGVDIDTISKIRNPVKYSSILFHNRIIKDPFILLCAWTIFEAYSKSTGIPLAQLFKSDFSYFAADLALGSKDIFYNNFKFFPFQCSPNAFATICEKIVMY